MKEQLNFLHIEILKYQGLIERYFSEEFGNITLSATLNLKKVFFICSKSVLSFKHLR